MNIEIKSFQTNGIISIVEFVTSNANTIEYISGAQALKENVIDVREISQTGNVNKIIIVNRSNHFVFFSDGDIVSGAKQNRVFNSSVFIDPYSSYEIPVSCVERGRWNQTTKKFQDSDYTAPVSLRANKLEQVSKSLEQDNQHQSQQSKIWQEITHIACEMEVVSPTESITDVFIDNDERYRSFIKMFIPNSNANGLCIFKKNNILSVEVFNRSNIYSEYFNKLIKAVGLQSFKLKKEDPGLREVEAVYKTNTFFDELDNRDFHVFPGVALGEEKRFKSPDISGFILNYKNHFIHLSAHNKISN